MSDIVERLRDADTTRRIGESYADTHERRQRDRDEAADTIATMRAEIERLTNLHHTGVAYMAEADKALTTLRATNERLRGALQHISNLSSTEPHAMQIKARATLTQEKQG